MSERLTDERIDAVERMIISWLPSGVESIRSEGAQVFAELRHYKKLAEERGAALEWYADEDHYTDGDIGYLHNKSTVEYDGGERARQALGKEPQP